MNIDTKKLPTVHELFRDGLSKAFRPGQPPPPGSMQHRECERFFVAGFRACLLVQLHGIAAISDEEGIRVMDRWHAECEAYFKTLTNNPQN